MISFFCLFQGIEILLQVFVIIKCRTVNSLQNISFFIAAPVSTGNT
jgi:hypothetical protein